MSTAGGAGAGVDIHWPRTGAAAGQGGQPTQRRLSGAFDTTTSANYSRYPK